MSFRPKSSQSGRSPGRRALAGCAHPAHPQHLPALESSLPLDLAPGSSSCRLEGSCLERSGPRGPGRRCRAAGVTAERGAGVLPPRGAHRAETGALVSLRRLCRVGGCGGGSRRRPRVCALLPSPPRCGGRRGGSGPHGRWGPVSRGRRHLLRSSLCTPPRRTVQTTGREAPPGPVGLPPAAWVVTHDSRGADGHFVFEFLVRNLEKSESQALKKRGIQRFR